MLGDGFRPARRSLPGHAFPGRARQSLGTRGNYPLAPLRKIHSSEILYDFDVALFSAGVPLMGTTTPEIPLGFPLQLHPGLGSQTEAGHPARLLYSPLSPVYSLRRQPLPEIATRTATTGASAQNPSRSLARYLAGSSAPRACMPVAAGRP